MNVEQQMLAKALQELATRGMRVETRMAYYEGRHPMPASTEAWKRTYGPSLKHVIDNQCRLIVDQRAEAVVPVGVQPVTAGDVLADGLAKSASELIDAKAGVIADALKFAEAAGEQLIVTVDWDDDGIVDLYRLDPRSAYAHINRAGTPQWVAHFWKGDNLDPTATITTEATLYTPTETIHLTSNSSSPLPAADSFREVGRRPNPFGELMLGVLSKSSSIVDTLAPLQDLLNKSLQTMAVVGEAYALPRTVWFGIAAYDPETGKVTGPKLQTNPASGSRDISIPTVSDEEGDKRDVVQLPSPEPEKYLKDQDALRAAMARNGKVPAFLLQSGSAPESGEALEIAYRPRVEQKATDERVVGPFIADLMRKAVRRRLYSATGNLVDVPAFRTLFAKDTGATVKSRVEQVTAAVGAGMTLADALVEFYGMTPEAAERIAANADEAAAAASDRSVALFEQGVPLDGE